MSRDTFEGRWLVSEYVYNPDGSYAGRIAQTRWLERRDNGVIRVHQQCTPEPHLHDHPMGAFAGEWVFDLSVTGEYRRYHGPDVVGSGRTWGEGAMTGRGIWPRFGHNFRSFAVLSTPDRQLTGGKFFHGPHLIATVVGVGVPEAATQDWPTLDISTPTQHADAWRGTLCQITPGGPATTTPLQRHDDGLSWREEGAAALSLEHTATEPCICVGGAVHGFGRRAGPLLEIEAMQDTDRCLELLEVTDHAAGQIVGVRRWFIHDVLEQVAIVRLSLAGQE